MENLPKVTILVLSYNHAPFISQTIMSVLNQVDTNIELIVADDKSTDNSVEIIKVLSEKYKFKFVKNEVNGGVNTNMLSAYQFATGQYIAILASDDYLVPDKIKKQIKYIADNNLDGLYSTGFIVEENHTKEIIPVNKTFLSGNNKKIVEYICLKDAGPLMQSGLFKRFVFEELATYRKDFKSDDMYFLIKAFENYNIGFLNEPLFYYRQHANNTYKKYWHTFPQRIDVVARLMPVQYRTRALGNIIFSQGRFLMSDGHFFEGVKFFLSSLFLNFSLSNVKNMILAIGVFCKHKIIKKK